jgi:hypothetical protein
LHFSLLGRLPRRLIVTTLRLETSNKTALRRRRVMKSLFTLLLLGSLGLGGCEFVAGAATGALATGAGYEINAKRQMDRIENDYRNERISRREYERRKNQIERGSIVY